jgi:4-hydroxybenzoate polyprenyltransferase/phosphoserine phosphatase
VLRAREPNVTRTGSPAREHAAQPQPQPSVDAVTSSCPLVVDLDGTLIHTDTLHECALRIVRDSPLQTLAIPLWLYSGKAVLKQRLAARATVTAQTLPYNESLLEWLKTQRDAGRRLILCTACDSSIAERVAEHLGIFDAVIASDGSANLSGPRKAERLEQLFGRGGFDYVGNSSADLPVWARARRAVVVNAPAALARKAGALCEVERVFPPAPRGLSAWRRVLRVHQWAKNLLLVVPMLAAHQVFDLGAWQSLALAFVSFSLCASSVYILNDLLDLESDRRHPRKRMRPFASGAVPVWMGVVLAPILLAASLGLGSLVGGRFLPWLLFYAVLTSAYSWLIKRIVLVDCLTLALLYTLRIVAGAAAVGQTLSFWLLAFSGFLFLSLAFVKRYAELEVQQLAGKETVHGRGYRTADAPLIRNMGTTAGYAAALVLALYLNSDVIVTLYRSPQVVWGTVPLLLFWISWMWLQAHRGRMNDDPLVFAIKDPASLVAGALFAAVLVAGTMGVPW